MAYDINVSLLESSVYNEIENSIHWEHEEVRYLFDTFSVHTSDNEIVISFHGKMPMAFQFEEFEDGQFYDISVKPCLTFYVSRHTEFTRIMHDSTMSGRYIPNDKD